MGGEPNTDFLDYYASVKLADEDQLYELSLKIVPKSGNTMGFAAGGAARASVIDEKEKERTVSFASGGGGGGPIDSRASSGVV